MEETNTDYKTKLFVVYCDKYSKAELQKKLEEFKTSEKSIVSEIKVVYDYKINKDSNRNLCVLSKDVHQNMLEHGHTTKERTDGISVAYYKLSDKDFPIKGGKRNTFFIRLPTKNTASYYRDLISQKLEKLKNTRLFNCKYDIEIPLHSRIVGSHSGYAMVRFSSTSYKIALTRLMLDGQQWNKDSTDRMNVLWYREHKKHFNGHKTKFTKRKQKAKLEDSKEDSSDSDLKKSNSSENDDLLQKLKEHYKENED